MTETYQLDELINRTHTLMEELNEKQIDRKELIQLLVVSLFSLKHTFLLGEPGVSKTGILEIFSTAIESEKKFSITIKNDTKYEEIFGDRFRDESGRLQYDPAGSIVEASFAMIDETWKGNSKVMNSLLSIMSNYRTIEIMGKGQIKVPLLMVGGASNELPLDKEVRPLRDRFLFSYVVKKITGEAQWIKFASRQYDRVPVVETKFLPDEILKIYELSNSVTIPQEIYSALFNIRQKVVSLEIGVSERKFDGAIDVFLVSAFLNRREEVNFSELYFLLHILWEKETDIPLIRKIVNDETFGQLDAVITTYDEICKTENWLLSLLNGRMNSFIKHRKAFSFEEEESFDSQCNDVLLLADEFAKVLSSLDFLGRHYDMNMMIEKQTEDNYLMTEHVSPVYFNFNIALVKESITRNRKIEQFLRKWFDDYNAMYAYNEKVNF
ncbi:MAG: AAA family ATPase [Sulfurimonas sp.]|nr:AAA family ATPase [Sulfurimonas sp.]